MAKKRISLDLDLNNPWERDAWEYLCTKKVKAKELRRILFNYLNGLDDTPVFMRTNTPKQEEPKQEEPKQEEPKLRLMVDINDIL